MSIYEKENVLMSINNKDIVDGVYVVPEGIEKISASVFYNKKHIKEIKLPSTLKEIGAYALAGTSIEKIEIPESCTKIMPGAFSNCLNLKEINLPKNLSSLNDNTFVNCQSLKEINIPDNVEYIESSCFKNCVNLSNIKLPKNLQMIAEQCFQDCSSLRQVDFPDGLTSIGNSCFMDCDKLLDIELPSSVREIGSSCFEGCLSLKSAKLSNSIRFLSNGVFKDCLNLENINFPKDLIEILDKAFYSCNKLREINLPEGLKRIDAGSFMSCFNLTSVHLPDSLETIESESFRNCKKLENINFPKNLLLIIDGAFRETNLKSIELPSSLKFVGESVFRECNSLKFADLSKVNIPISTEMFRENRELERVILSPNIDKINKEAFKDCFALKEINLSDSSIKEISESAFSGCSVLDNVLLPNNLKIIGDSAFTDCSSLSKIIIPKSVEDMGMFAFNNCQNLENAEILADIKEIKPSTFCHCTGLKEITFPKSLISIGSSAFYYCYNLSNINFPKNLVRILGNAFNSCNGIEEIELPDSLEELGEASFRNCINLNKIKLSKNLKTIGVNALSNTNLNQIDIPSSVKGLQIYKINLKDKPSYFTKIDDGFRISTIPQEGSMSLEHYSENTDLAFLSNHYNYADKLAGELRNPLLSSVYNSLVSNLSEENIDKFLNSHNFTFFKQIAKRRNEEFNSVILGYDSKEKRIYKAFYNLGLFEEPVEVKGKMVNYAQKVSEFIQSKLEGGKWLYNFSNLLANTRLDGFKREFTDFFMENFEKLLVIESNNKNFISRCYNEFEDVQKTNTNNHGSQRQLKATVEKFINYFDENKFAGITDETREIANTISQFFNNQSDFDNAVSIFNEWKKSNISEHILKTPLSEKEVFANIDNMAQECQEIIKDTLGTLVPVTDRQFTFEWLAKNDPQNFILGKFCSCCAHLEGAGYGIMRASIIHPNVQNLVIRNSHGDIVAKSTLYVNPKEGYGVFNNVEVNNNVDYKKIPEIYKKYILGIRMFAQQYNKEHPNEPLKQINVGMNMNDLGNNIRQNNTRSIQILDAIDFSKFGDHGLVYGGDSSDEQYIVWSADEEKNKTSDINQFGE